MEFSSLLFLKPILTTLIIPPAGPLVLVLFGWIVSFKRKTSYQRIASLLVFTGAAGLWILSCENTAVWLSESLLPQYAPVTTESIKEAQVIMVLGGGAEPLVVEYGGPDLSMPAYERLRYAVHLSKKYNLPLAYSGGVGWGAGPKSIAEAEVAKLILKKEWNIDLDLKLMESQSKDTRQNANFSYALLSKQGIKHIALVTHAWHMPRASRNFKDAGFEVIPAPMGYISLSQSPLMDALPSDSGLRDSRWVLREWLGMGLT